MISLEQIYRDTELLATEVVQFIRNESQNFDSGQIEQKSGWNNLVSYVDKESEKKLVSGLSKILSGAGFLGEEGTDIPSSNGYTWIIDPLDGTTNFTHGFPPFAVSIGLNHNHETVLGIVFEVMSNECFGSFTGAPVWCNKKEVRVAGTTSLSRSLIATGFPYDTGDRMDVHLSIIRDLLKQTHGVRRLGSAATDLAYVACGRLDGFFEYNLSPWDVAAGAFLVRQAGGKVTDFKGGSDFLFGRQLCAANTVHQELLGVVQKNWLL